MEQILILLMIWGKIVLIMLKNTWSTSMKCKKRKPTQNPPSIVFLRVSPPIELAINKAMNFNFVCWLILMKKKKWTNLVRKDLLQSFAFVKKRSKNNQNKDKMKKVKTPLAMKVRLTMKTLKKSFHNKFGTILSAVTGWYSKPGQILPQHIRNYKKYLKLWN